mmetsp:Transcript_688/g.1136  ORF Transcript_688/g.1136 Transcript_688/m.1136 type:complete len:226 (-) Transcript_688:3901-4578(-)
MSVTRSRTLVKAPKLTLNIRPQGAVFTTPFPSATNMSSIQGNSLNSSPTALFCSFHRSTPAVTTFLLLKQGVKLFPITLASFSSTHSSLVFTELLIASSPSLALFSIVTNQGYFLTTSLSAALSIHTSSMCFSLSLLECCPPSCPPSQTMSAPKASPASLVMSSSLIRSVKYRSASAASSRCLSSVTPVAPRLTPPPRLSFVTNSTLVTHRLFFVNRIATFSAAS